MTNTSCHKIHDDCAICRTHKSVFTYKEWEISLKYEKEKSKKKKVKVNAKRYRITIN